jgi:hypothetical protein
MFEETSLHVESEFISLGFSATLRADGFDADLSLDIVEH